MKKYITSAIILLSLAVKVLACSCSTTLIDLPIQEMGWTQTETDGISSFSDAIFSGLLIDYEKVAGKSQVEMTFKLIKSYRGEKNDTVSDLEGADEQVKVEKIVFRGGKPAKSTTGIKDFVFVWEEPLGYQILRKQKVKRKYRHYRMKQ